MGMSCWDEVIKSCHVFQIAVDRLNHHMLQLAALKQFMLSCELKQLELVHDACSPLIWLTVGKWWCQSFFI